MSKKNDKTGLQNTSEHDKNKQQPHLVAAARRISFSGPIPPPEILAGYERITPGLADRVIKLTEFEGNHRRELESKHLQAGIEHQKRIDCEGKLGQLFAFIIAITAILGGVYTALKGHEGAGAFISALGISGIVTAFLTTRDYKKDKKLP